MASSLVEEEKAQAKGKGRRTKIVGVVPESFSQDYVTNEKVKRLVKAYCQTSNACFLSCNQTKTALADFVKDYYDQENVAPKTKKACITAMVYTSLGI